jgi:hypothetical protein
MVDVSGGNILQHFFKVFGSKQIIVIGIFLEHQFQFFHQFFKSTQIFGDLLLSFEFFFGDGFGDGISDIIEGFREGVRIIASH